MQVFNHKLLVWKKVQLQWMIWQVSVQRIAESASSVAELAVATSEHASDGSTVIQNLFHK